MKLLDTLLISFAVATCLIGFHQTFTSGVFQNYWIFMLTISALAWFQLRRKKAVEEEQSKNIKNKKRKGKRK